METRLFTAEKDLLLRLSQNSTTAFNEIYTFYRPRIYGKLLKMLKSESNANEILQEVFLKIWELRNRIDPEKSFRSYLFRITENKIYDFFRKAAIEKKLHRELVMADKYHYNHIEETIEDNEKNVVLNEAINSLPPQRRLIFMLCKLEQKSYRDVSEKLNISISTVSDHIVKANACIQKYVSGCKPGLIS